MDARLHDPTVAATHPGLRRVGAPDRLQVGFLAAPVVGELAAETLPHFPMAIASLGLLARKSS